MDMIEGTKFQIFSGLLKTSRSQDGKMRLHGVASSTTRDLHGDVMESSALEDMERSANGNLTIFLNHSYEVPEDVAGSVERAALKTRGADHEGNPNYDLDMDILINDANPRAVKAFEAIEKGTKLGLSIGALIPEGGAIRDKKSGTYTIQHVDLLETSLVGIPANPRSWVEYAAKSLRGAEKIDKDVTVPLGQPTLTLNDANYTITGTYDSTTWSSTPTITATLEETVKACPSCGESKAASDDCADSYHKDVTPEITDATVTVIQIDTGQESSESDPSPNDDPPSQATETEDGEYAAGEPELTLAGRPEDPVQLALHQLTATTSELVTATKRVSELQASVLALTNERDQARTQRDRVVAETLGVLNRLQTAPFARKAIVTEATVELRQKWAGVYDETFLKTLEYQNDRVR